MCVFLVGKDMVFCFELVVSAMRLVCRGFSMSFTQNGLLK